MQRYADSLTAALLGAGLDASVIRPPVLFGRLRRRGRGAKVAGYLDKFVVFPLILFLKARAADIIHICDHGNAMYTWVLSSRRTVITCHDVFSVGAALGHCTQAPISRLGHILQAAIVAGLRRANGVICVSKSTALCLAELVFGGRNRSKVIHHCLNWDYRPSSLEEVREVRKRWNLSALYLLHVGNNNWYKNRDGVIRIVAHLKNLPECAGVKLVMAGKPLTATLLQSIHDLGLQDTVIAVHRIKNEELAALYTGAAALLFPSLAEGFGWPILEAQACGCPVITSDREPMREVAGNGALFIDPTDPLKAAECIARAMTRLSNLRTAGFENLRRFNQEDVLGKYLAFYQGVLNTSPAK